MKNCLLIILVLTLTFCKDNIIEVEKEKQGSVKIALNKTNIPDNVITVKATVSRSGFDEIIKELNLLSETSAEIQIKELETGTWHLKIEALDINNNSLYTGESDIDVKPGEIAAVSITLTPSFEDKGGIYIYVSWDTLPYSWFDQPTNPIITKTGSVYDNYGVGQAVVLYEDDIYKMWYNGLSNSGVTYVFYATSTDGLNWSRYGSTPILFPGANSTWDSKHVSVGAIIKEDGQYKMYYVGWKDQYSQWGIGMATSYDGINWTKKTNPVLTGGSWDYQMGATSIIKIGSLYYMYYSGKSSTSASSSIGLATSFDGIQWTKHYSNPIMTGTLAWENNITTYPAVIYEDNLFKMIYQCGSTNSFGIAYSQDGTNWIKKSDAPFYKSDMTVHKLRIAYPMILRTNDEYRIYYTAFTSDDKWLICVARKFN